MQFLSSWGIKALTVGLFFKWKQQIIMYTIYYGYI